ncbi:hypothetical protein [Cryobacterium sp. GrIS_2_6]|uniref:hypothetical protein n=1 Tax=Cryobacterium sp. GrIS_2_6 TaxID=3162785 RepID=UPI002E0B8B4D|nr:hypothetical protein [Cryobacterium psychrotolerans]
METREGNFLMISGRLEARASEDIQVQALSHCEWRVIDRRIARSNALSLVGFIAKDHGRYEVMEFIDPVGHAAFSNLDEAIGHFVNISSDSAASAQSEC